MRILSRGRSISKGVEEGKIMVLWRDNEQTIRLKVWVIKGKAVQVDTLLQREKQTYTEERK